VGFAGLGDFAIAIMGSNDASARAAFGSSSVLMLCYSLRLVGSCE
jgi:hypothetical protein